MIGLINDLENVRKSIGNEVNLLLDSINSKIDKDDDLKKRISNNVSEEYGLIEFNRISCECRYTDYGHDQYVFAIRENCKLEVCIAGCGNSEVDLCETDSCIETALETASVESIKNCFKFLLRVDKDLNALNIR